MSDEDTESNGVEAENPNLNFIKEVVGSELQQIVREDSDLKGVFNIEVQTNGKFNIKLHDGTEGEPRVIEDISKEKLLAMMEDKL